MKEEEEMKATSAIIERVSQNFFVDFL